MQRFLARAQPSFESVLLIESGPREVTEKMLRFLYESRGVRHLDVLTCYSTAPNAFRFAQGSVYSVNDEEARRNRGAFIRKLASGPYTILALLCTGSPILEKWKWVLALRSAARIIIVNEGAKYFGLEIWSHKSARLMLAKRLNPFADFSRESLAVSLATIFGRAVLIPFTLSYLLLYSAALHSRRWLRMKKLLPS